LIFNETGLGPEILSSVIISVSSQEESLEQSALVIFNFSIHVLDSGTVRAFKCKIEFNDIIINLLGFL
jgi:hypothetical protein